MKKLILLALLSLMAVSLQAQNKYDPRTNNNIIFKVVGPNLNIKDKIKIWNRSPYTLTQVVVCVVENGELVPLGTCNDVDPDDDCDIASYKNNSLKNLRGRTLAIKAKGIKSEPGSRSSTKVRTPYGNVEVKRKSSEATEDKPEEYTYEFEAKLFEDKHDLFIELFASSNQDVMDF